MYERDCSPCLDCLDRTETCHAHCERYISWKARHEQSRQEQIKKNQQESDLRNCAVMRGKRHRRKRKDV